MPNQFRKSRTFGALVIAMSLISTSVTAASNQALSLARNAPMQVIATPNGADIIQVQDRRPNFERDRNRGRVDRRSDRRFDRRDDRRFDRWDDRRFDRRDDRRHGRADRHFDRRGVDTRYRKGHRGYRDYRPGYRRDNDGWWYPLAAFALGAAIIHQQNRTRTQSPVYAAPSYRSWSHIPAGNMAAHDNWCDRQYRSYSRITKTFQPYQGPRRYCNSPYDRL